MDLNTHDLRLPSTLHKRLSSPILRHCLNIVRKAIRQAGQTQRPKQQAERERDLFLNTRRLTLKMERHHNCG